MPTTVTTDRVEIYDKDCGAGRPVVFSHGWPLTADAWDGNDMDTYANDLASLIEALDLRQAVLVGHSTGGGEVAHYIGRHGTSRLYAGAPHGLPTTHQDQLNADLLAFIEA